MEPTPGDVTTDPRLIQSLSWSAGGSTELSPVTVILGPNGAGKSEVLKDIVRLLTAAEPEQESGVEQQDAEPRVLSDATLLPRLTTDRLLLGLKQWSPDDGKTTTVQGLGPDLRSPCERTVPKDLKNILYRPVLAARSIRATSLGALMPLRVAYWSYQSDWLASPVMISPRQAPEHLLQALFEAPPSVHEQLDSLFAQAFSGQHVRLDASERVQLTLRAAAEFPEPAAVAWHRAEQYAHLPQASELSQGSQSYLSLLLAVLLCRGRVLLLDHPEAHLHPALAERLGSWLTASARSLSCQLIVATHSEALLQGLLQQPAQVTVIRLTRRQQTVTPHEIDPDTSAALARFPLLASQQALGCLFTSGAVLVPDHYDRIVYETAAKAISNEREFRFLDVPGYRQLAGAIRVLRKAGVPTCAVTSLDVFQHEVLFSEVVSALTGDDPPAPWLATRDRLARYVEGMSDEDALATHAHEVEVFLEKLKHGEAVEGQATAASPQQVAMRWQRVAREQLHQLPQELRVWVDELLEDLKRHGLFVSPKHGIAGWFDIPGGESGKGTAFSKGLQTLMRGECPPDLRTFLMDVIAQVRAFGQPARAQRVHRIVPAANNDTSPDGTFDS